MANNVPYNQQDIQRYLQQQMTPKEMHDFEKAMHEDPFLADAFEGYSKADEVVASQHLTAIANALGSTKSQAKIVPMARQRTAWWQIAALILLLVGAGIITYRISNPGTTYHTAQELAEAKSVQQEIISDTLRPAGVPFDQASLAPSPDIASKKPSPPVIVAQAEPIAPATATAPPANDNLVVMQEKMAYEKAIESRAMKSKMAEAVTSESRAMYAAPPAPVNNFEGKVVDPSGEPLPFATVKVENSNMGTVTDAQGNFVIKGADTTLDVTVESLGYATTRAKLKNNPSTSNIVIQENNASLSERVVTDITARRQSAAAKKSSITAEPIGGWDNFYNYVKQQSDNNEAIRSLQLQEIDVEFIVSRKGKPYNISVLNDPRTEVAAIARKLLENGPRWQSPLRNEKVKLKLYL